MLLIEMLLVAVELMVLVINIVYHIDQKGWDFIGAWDVSELYYHYNK